MGCGGSKGVRSSLRTGSLDDAARLCLRPLARSLSSLPPYADRAPHRHPLPILSSSHPPPPAPAPTSRALQGVLTSPNGGGGGGRVRVVDRPERPSKGGGGGDDDPALAKKQLFAMQWECHEKLGSGQFADVFRATEKRPKDKLRPRIVGACTARECRLALRCAAAHLAARSPAPAAAAACHFAATTPSTHHHRHRRRRHHLQPSSSWRRAS